MLSLSFSNEKGTLIIIQCDLPSFNHNIHVLYIHVIIFGFKSFFWFKNFQTSLIFMSLVLAYGSKYCTKENKN